MKCEKKDGTQGEVNGVYYIFDKKYPLFCYYEPPRDWYRYVMMNDGIGVDAKSSLPLSDTKVYNAIYRPMKRVLIQELRHRSLTTK